MTVGTKVSAFWSNTETFCHLTHSTEQNTVGANRDDHKSRPVDYDSGDTEEVDVLDFNIVAWYIGPHWPFRWELV